MSERVLVIGTGTFCSRVSELLRKSGVPFVALNALVEEVNTTGVTEALYSIRDYDWAVFTSVNAVNAVTSVARQLGIERPLEGLRYVGAVGSSTSSALRRIWDGEIFVPSRFTTSALAEELPDVEGSSVIAFRSELANDNMASALTRRGARRVVQVGAYSVRMKKDVELPEDHGLVLLGSPSAVRCYLTLCNSTGCEPRPAICIGPVTSAAAAEMGLVVLGVAEVQTVEGLVRKIMEVVQG